MRWVYAVLGEYAFRAVRVVGELFQHGAHLLFVRETLAQRLPDRLGRIQQPLACLTRAVDALP